MLRVQVADIYVAFTVHQALCLAPHCGLYPPNSTRRDHGGYYFKGGRMEMQGSHITCARSRILEVAILRLSHQRV